MPGLTFAVLGYPHRLAPHRALAEGRWRYNAPFRLPQNTQDAGDISERSRVDDAQGFSQCRVKRRRSTTEAKVRLLTPCRTASEMRRRLHAAPSAQQRYDDQAKDRPLQVLLPLLTTRAANRAAKSSSIARAIQQITLGFQYFGNKLTVHEDNRVTQAVPHIIAMAYARPAVSNEGEFACLSELT
jgi:hypothetical protein